MLKYVYSISVASEFSLGLLSCWESNLIFVTMLLVLRISLILDYAFRVLEETWVNGSACGVLKFYRVSHLWI